MLNQDMTGYSPGGTPVVFTDYTNTALNTYMRLIIRQYTGITSGTSSCGYGCSDHASATSNGFREYICGFDLSSEWQMLTNGIAASFVHEDTMSGSSPYIHTANDVSLMFSNALSTC